MKKKDFRMRAVGRSLTFSIHLNKIAELGATSETFLERLSYAPGLRENFSHLNTHIHFRGLTSVTVPKPETGTLSNIKEDLFHVQTESEHAHFYLIKVT